MTHLPTHPHLRHPRTGQPLQALGYNRRGQPIWPVLGASQPLDPAPVDPPPDPAPVDPPTNPDPPLDDPGKRALAAERSARKAAEKTAKELTDRLQAIENAGKSEAEKTAERLAAAEKAATVNELRALRAEVAAEKGLTAAQAKRLVGATADELAADADELLATFGAPKQSGPRRDPSQGAKGTPPVDLDARIAAAQKAGDFRGAVALQMQKLTPPQ